MKKTKPRALLVATTASMIEQFNQHNIHVLQKMGYEVHVACNFEAGNTISDDEVVAFRRRLKEANVKSYDLPISRSPLARGKNMYSVLRLRRLIKRYKYDIIHCHTPMGSVDARIAAYTVRKWHGRVIYTAHGFHFYKGAPLVNKLLYKTVEHVLAHITDSIVTINEEDYQSAQNFRMKNEGKVYKIPGVGIDVAKIRESEANEDLRKELGLGDFPIILSVGELNDNKNHRVIIEAMQKMHNKNFLYVICGQGGKYDELKALAQKNGLENRVRLLGYRDDVLEIMKLASIFVHPSYREGLSVALMQAMAAGLPVVVSKIRGNVDLIKDGINGFLCAPDDVNAFALSLDRLLDDETSRERFMKENLERSKKYDFHQVNMVMQQIYGDF